MAVAFDQVAEEIDNSGGGHTSITGRTINITAGNPILICLFFFDGPEGVSSLAVTYDSVSMTQLFSQRANSADFYIHAMVLVNPTTGSAISPIATFGSTNRFTGIMSLSYTGVNQSNPVTYGGSSPTGSSTTQVATITTDSTANSWVVWMGMNDANNFIASTNVTFRGATSSINMGDSNGTVPTSSSYAQTTTTATSGRYTLGQIEISPATAAGPTNLKSLDTNVKSNIKSYNTNVLANIKSINTNT